LSIGFGSFNMMTPWGVENNFLECHAAVWVGRVSDMDIHIKVLVSYADDWNGSNIVEMLVVVSD